MLNKLYVKETIKRVNDQTLYCKDTEEDRQRTIGFVQDMMTMLNIRKIDYEIQLERVAETDGTVLDRIHLVCTMI